MCTGVRACAWWFELFVICIFLEFFYVIVYDMCFYSINGYYGIGIIEYVGLDFKDFWGLMGLVYVIGRIRFIVWCFWICIFYGIDI